MQPYVQGQRSNQLVTELAFGTGKQRDSLLHARTSWTRFPAMFAYCSLSFSFTYISIIICVENIIAILSVLSLMLALRLLVIISQYFLYMAKLESFSMYYNNLLYFCTNNSIQNKAQKRAQQFQQYFALRHSYRRTPVSFSRTATLHMMKSIPIAHPILRTLPEPLQDPNRSQLQRGSRIRYLFLSAFTSLISLRSPLEI